MHGASEQCMQATEIDLSCPTTPSLIVTTRRRLTPQGTSCSFLHAVTQLLHSMQRSASQMNFIRAMVFVSSLSLLRPASSAESFDVADGGFGFLHHRDRIVAVGGRRVDGLAAHHRGRTLRVILQHVPA